MNAGRYTHMHARDHTGRQVTRSPFNRGVLMNVVDFYGCKLGGLFRPQREDEWMTRYVIEEDQQQNDKRPLLAAEAGFVV